MRRPTDVTTAERGAILATAQLKIRTFADSLKIIGSSPNAVRMQKVVSFYEKLPRGPAPEPQGKGLLGRYQKKYMGKNPSGRRTYTQHPAPTIYRFSALMVPFEWKNSHI